MRNIFIKLCSLILLWQLAGSCFAQGLPSTTEFTQSNPSDHYFHLQRNKITRWNDQTKYIMVHITDGSYLPGWSPAHVTAIKNAFWEWEVAMNGRFHFIYMPDERGSDVKVTWATRILHDDFDEAAGINEYVTWDKYIKKNDIKMALLHSTDRAYPLTMIHSIALHEIGHMLGLKAHSDTKGDVMYPGRSPSAWSEVQHLNQRDINTLQMVYASPANYTNPEGYHLSDFDSFQKKHKGRRMSLLWVPVPGLPVPVPVPLPF